MTAKETITNVLDVLGMTPTEFARHVGLNRPQAIFDIQSGKTKNISKAMAHKIKLAYPAFNEEWLRTGVGDMLEQELPAGSITSSSVQAVSRANLDDCLRIIQDLVKQNSEKDKQIQSLQESYRFLSTAFDTLAQKYGLVMEEPQKEAM